MEEGLVTFKGTVNGLKIILKEDADFQAIYDCISKKIARAGKFFKNATLWVKYKGKDLSEHEEKQIFELLSNHSGAVIKSFEKDNEKDEVHENNSKSTYPRFEITSNYFRGLEEGITKFFRGTVRSGQLLSFPGNVIVIGDVNPGGEIIALGNIIVLGTLRGLVHAGADGNKDAFIVAFNLQPTQIRIADVITRPPDEKEIKDSIIPEIAYVKDGTIYIENYIKL